MCIHYFLIKRKKLFGRPNKYRKYSMLRNIPNYKLLLLTRC